MYCVSYILIFKVTGRCLFSQLQNFVTSATGIQTTGQSSLMQLPTETGLVLNGSYIVFSCINGYVNIGGSLNLTCNNNNSWSQLPNCVLNTGGSSLTTTTMPLTTITMPLTTTAITLTTTTMPASNGSPCVVNATSTFNLTNGYALIISLFYTSNTAATGNSTKLRTLFCI